MGTKPALEIIGSLDSPGGALFITHGLEGIAQQEVYLVRFRMMKDGIQITPEIEAGLQRLQSERLQQMKDEIAARGVSDNLTRLMAAKRKKDAKALAKAMTVTTSELGDLILNHRQIGFTHREKHPESAPPNVVPTGQEIQAALNTVKVGEKIGPELTKLFGKIDSLQRQRRCVAAHMFQKADGWHLFYSSYEDAFELPWKPNHFEHGPHVHYSSQLFCRRNPDDVWAALEERKFKIEDVHIRLKSK